MMPPWKPSRLQAVWFVMTAAEINASEVFGQAFGNPPDSSQRNRSLSAQAPFFSIASSDIEQEHFEVLVHPGRVDLSISAAPSADGSFSIMLPRGDINRRLDELGIYIDACSKIFVPGVSRVALNVTLATTQPDLKSATASLNLRLGNPIPFDDGSDISIQANRSKSFTFNPALVMNRLLRFNVVAYQKIAMPVSGPGGVSMVGLPASEPTYSEQFLLDINNAPTGDSYGPSVAKSIWSELILETQRLSHEGNLRGLL